MSQVELSLLTENSSDALGPSTPPHPSAATAMAVGDTTESSTSVAPAAESASSDFSSLPRLLSTASAPAASTDSWSRREGAPLHDNRSTIPAVIATTTTTTGAAASAAKAAGVTSVNGLREATASQSRPQDRRIPDLGRVEGHDSDVGGESAGLETQQSRCQFSINTDSSNVTPCTSSVSERGRQHDRRGEVAMPSGTRGRAAADKNAALSAAPVDNRKGDDSGAAETTPCRITATQWNAVATWSWSVQTDSCAICKNFLADACVECQMTMSSSSLLRSPTAPPPPPGPASTGTPSTMETFSSVDQCTISWGRCGHVFHSHCISRWLAERRVCPLCGRDWALYKSTKND